MGRGRASQWEGRSTSRGWLQSLSGSSCGVVEAVGGSVSDGPRSSPSLIPIPIVIDISHINYHCPPFHCNRHDCLHLQMLQVLTFPLTLIIFHGKVDFGGVFPFGITRLDTFCLDVYG